MASSRSITLPSWWPGFAWPPPPPTVGNSVSRSSGGLPQGGPAPLASSRRCSGRVLLTLAGAVKGDDRDLEHVVGRLAGRELLSREDWQQHDLDDRVGAVAGHEADELESRARDDRDRQHAACYQPEPVRVEQRHDREHDHTHDQDHEQEAGAAARVKKARATNRHDLEWPSRLIGVDRLVLGPVVLEDAAHVAQKRDQRQVAQDEAHADDPFHEDEDEAPVLMDGEAGKQEREADEDEECEDTGDRDRAADLLLADFDSLAARVHVRRPHERFHAEMQLLADESESPHERKLPERVDVDRRFELAPIDNDLPGGREAHCDGVVPLAAHHHAFDYRLSAIEERLFLWRRNSLRSGSLRQRHLVAAGLRRPLTKTLDLAARVHDPLGAGEERVAHRADLGLELFARRLG